MTATIFHGVDPESGERTLAVRVGDTLTTPVRHAELLDMADAVLSGDGQTRTHPLTLNLLAAGVLAFAAKPAEQP